MAMSMVYSQLSGHKWYVYIDKSLFISRVLFMYPQEMFIHIEGVEDCRQVDKIKVHNVIPNDIGIGPYIRSSIYN